MWKMKILAFFLVLEIVEASRMSRVTVKYNGYEGVVVGISPMLREDAAQDIINAIKIRMTEASETLFIATQRKLYFKDVKILIPKAWTNTSIDAVATTERFEESEVRIDLVNGVYNHQPYTVQPGGCGEPGLYIHLTPEYLMNHEEAKWWGPRGKVLTKQWAQLRWGVFDEIGYANDYHFPLYYWNQEIVNGNVQKVLKPNTCTDNVPTGRWMDTISKKDCVFEGEIPNRNCRFVPDANQNITSSLMAYQYMDSVKEFCDKSVFIHDSVAPNRQNLLCNARSAWDIMNRHSDFGSIVAAPPSLNVTPHFAVVQEVEANFALVLDYSGSMGTANRIGRLQKSAQRWILHEVAEGSSVGIVKFTDLAYELAPLTQITNDTSRQQLAETITAIAGGATCIGCGLQMAVNRILKGRENKVIILISDGEETNRPYISDVMQEVVASGSRVVTIAYGNAASQKMEELAQNTGGKSYIVFDNDDGSMADDAFDGALTYQPGDALTNVSVEIYEYSYQGREVMANDSFVVDATLGRNLVFRLDSDEALHIVSTPVLISPNGTIFNNTIHDPTVNLWKLQVDFPENGTWHWEVGLSGSRFHIVRVTVTAQAKDPETLPIYTLSWISSGSENVDAALNPVIIYAKVSQGGMPVVGAKVRAYITRPDTTDAAVEIDLKDNGQGADIQGGDGIYSRYFTLFSVTGRYAVKAQVWDEGSSYINNGFIASRQQPFVPDYPYNNGKISPLALTRMAPADPLYGPEPCCGSMVPFYPSTAIPTGEFLRTTAAGSFQVINIPTTGDLAPPSRVLDLRVWIESYSLLNLTWTAPGDDYDIGVVSGYEIRMSTNVSELLEDTFDDADNTTLLLGVSESLNITELFVEAGETAFFQVGLQQAIEEGTVYFFALRAIDGFGKKSEVSNQAALLVNVVNPAVPVDVLPGWAVALIVIGTVMIAIVIVGAVVINARNKSQTQQSDGCRLQFSDAGSVPPPHERGVYPESRF